MTDRIDLGRLGFPLRAVGLALWAFVGIQRLIELAHDPNARRAWIIVWLVYGAAFCATALARLPDVFVGALLVVQTASALAMPWLGRAGFEGLMLSVVAAETAAVVSPRSAGAFAVAQLAALVVDVAPVHTLHEVIEISGAYGTFAAFALIATWLQRREVRSRNELARVHAELLEAHDRLEESSRAEERLRIARELHDTLGHHLAAMSIQLDLATRSNGDTARDALRASHAMSRRLLGEVRSVVSAIRDEPPVSLREALAGLGHGITEPVVQCEVADDLPETSAAQSHALFRCAQEALTNAMRHAGARHVWIELQARDDSVVLAVRDDGRGVAAVEPGGGLRGMRERFERLGGSVAFARSAGGGFEVRARLPCEKEAGAT